MHLRCGEIFSDHFITRLLLSRTVKELILKIGQHLPKLWTRVSFVFDSRGRIEALGDRKTPPRPLNPP